MKKNAFLRTITVLLLMITLISIPEVKAEDFESGLDGWQIFTNQGGLVQFSTTYAHSGMYSVEQVSQYSGSETGNIIGAIRLPVTSDLDQYELSAWVYVTQRTFADASSFFGFVFDHWDVRGYSDVYVGWDDWGLDGSYLLVRESEGYSKPYVPNGLTLDVWHHVNIIAYTNLGTISLWLDDQLIVGNYPSFNAGEKPIYYYIDSQANWWQPYVTHHYIDDVTTSEPSSPQASIQSLVDTIKAWNLPKGTENSLTSKLANAIQSLEKGQQNAAINKLNAFVNEVRAQSGKKLTSVQANLLTSEAQRIINMIQS